MEYVALIGIVIMAIVAMTPLLKRGIQSVVKVAADQIGVQNIAEPIYDQRRGNLNMDFTDRRTSMSEEAREVAGIHEYIYNDVDTTQKTSSYILGYTNRTE